jgi:hypothetical protein
MEINELLRKTQAGHAGIDYSHGMANVDTTTGIHYGVINQQEVLQAWADSSEPYYGEVTEVECPECGFLFTPAAGTEWGDAVTCLDNPAHEFEVGQDMELEAMGYDLNDGEYVAYAGDDGDIFIISSPYFTYAHFCSPCAPGAGHLTSPFKIPAAYKDTAHTLTEISPDTEVDLYKDLAAAAGFPKVFCFGHDWFETGKAPYRVFKISDGQEAKT